MMTWRDVLAVGLASWRKDSRAGAADGWCEMRLLDSRYSSASGSLRAAISSREDSACKELLRSDAIVIRKSKNPRPSFAKSLLHTAYSLCNWRFYSDQIFWIYYKTILLSMERSQHQGRRVWRAGQDCGCGGRVHTGCAWCAWPARTRLHPATLTLSSLPVAHNQSLCTPHTRQHYISPIICK